MRSILFLDLWERITLVETYSILFDSYHVSIQIILNTCTCQDTPVDVPISRHSNRPFVQPAVPPHIRTFAKKAAPKPLPDFNEAFGSTERGRFQSPPDPRLTANTKGYLDFFYEEDAQIKFEDYQA